MRPPHFFSLILPDAGGIKGLTRGFGFVVLKCFAHHFDLFEIFLGKFQEEGRAH